MFGGFRKKDKKKAAAAAAAAAASTSSNMNHDGSSMNHMAGNGGKQSSTGGGASSIAEKFGNMTLLTVKPLKDVSSSEQPKLFQRHLQLCHETFNFNDMGANLKEKEQKRLLLLGLVDYLNNPSTRMTEDMFPDIISMVSANIFRALPPRNDFFSDADEDEPILESAWPHLQIVYEFLLRFIVSSDVEPKQAKRYISHAFIYQLLGLFDSEDPRERDYLKTILHRIYGKFMALRAFIRKAIANVFLGTIYLDDKHNGIAELLEILGSIINGFALPLKAEHKRFLSKCLLPLHSVRNLATFHQQLEYCITQYVEKDYRMAEPVILGLLRYWPETNSPKQVQFLHELEEVLELTQLPEFRNICVPLFQRIASCLDSQHFQVAERALLLWNNEYLFTLITQNRAQILPLIYNILKRNSESHWNTSVQSLSNNVLQSFLDTDRALYEEVAKAGKTSNEEKATKRTERDALWKQLMEQHGNA